ncbi:MAG TPA: hypothetical protein VFX41_07865 [Actinomycetales bacterium]|nr:hypothetical protein [Actinomycetales bacterium]
MVATAEQLAALDASHQEQQLKNASGVASLILAYWALVRKDDIAGTGGEWLDKSTDAVVAGWRKSIDLSLAYTTTVRRLQAPRAAAPELPRIEIPNRMRDVSVIANEPRLLVPNYEQIRKSLAYTGLKGAVVGLQKTPQDIKPLAGDDTPMSPADRNLMDATNRLLAKRRQEAFEKAGAAATGAALRHVFNGGREAVKKAIKLDARVARGYVRVARIGCCYFCAMLASRGPVYGKDSFDESDPRFLGDEGTKHKVHDFCRCALRPVYTSSAMEWPNNSLDYDELWRRSTRDVSGSAKVRKFRAAYEASLRTTPV